LLLSCLKTSKMDETQFHYNAVGKYCQVEFKDLRDSVDAQNSYIILNLLIFLIHQVSSGLEVELLTSILWNLLK